MTSSTKDSPIALKGWLPKQPCGFCAWMGTVHDGKLTQVSDHSLSPT